MATDERSLGNLEGRMAEQSALLHQVHADLTAGIQQVNGRVGEAKARIDRLVPAIGGAKFPAVIGLSWLW